MVKVQPITYDKKIRLITYDKKYNQLRRINVRPITYDKITIN